MSFLPDDILYHELIGSPREKWTRGGMTAVRTLLVPWSQRFDFVRYMLYQGPRFRGQPYPGAPFSIVKDIDFEPFNAPEQRNIVDPAVDLAAAKDWAIAVVSYDLDPATTQEEEDDEDVEEGTYVSYVADDTVEALHVPGRYMKWQDNNQILPADSTAPIHVPLTSHQVTWHNVTTLPHVLISELKGKINSVDYRVPGSRQTIAKETLLFAGAKRRIQTTTEPGQRAKWEVTYEFLERRIKSLGAEGAPEICGWNHLYREERTAGWKIPISVEGSKKLYEVTDDFGNLFRY
jgi:hypothetical protein